MGAFAGRIEGKEVKQINRAAPSTPNAPGRRISAPLVRLAPIISTQRWPKQVSSIRAKARLATARQPCAHAAKDGAPRALRRLRQGHPALQPLLYARGPAGLHGQAMRHGQPQHFRTAQVVHVRGAHRVPMPSSTPRRASLAASMPVITSLPPGLGTHTIPAKGVPTSAKWWKARRGGTVPKLASRNGSASSRPRTKAILSRPLYVYLLPPAVPLPAWPAWRPGRRPSARRWQNPARRRRCRLLPRTRHPLARGNARQCVV